MNFDIKYDTFILGNKIDLVVLNEDIALESEWYNWFNSEETTQGMQKHYFPNTRSQQVDFYKNNIENSNTKLQLGIFHKKDKELIGVIGLNNIDYINRKCEFSGLIGKKEYRDLNNLVESCKLIIKHAFKTLNMNKVYGGTSIEESLPIYYRLLGFKQEGILRDEVYKNGSYENVYRIGLLHKEFDKIHKKYEEIK